ncbi:hypothetical protein VB780_29825 [Leptolyngbya sp. CCNP1308]|uniref:hypothetical protein n=1 Tax=Leptolyngbya sp. CCNP1308 TaxID=3110255 RepID=UPI002B20F9A5|nr:hypothetical protein [Leptolyngbya sp. CCNP1308]MEA5452808.1 hypothetical protein [Leptolyngbya sp. CCNP1308]
MVSLPASSPPVDLDHHPLGMGLEGLPNDDLALIEERCNWLRFHRLWGQLPEPAQQDLARSLHLE